MGFTTTRLPKGLTIEEILISTEITEPSYEILGIVRKRWTGQRDPALAAFDAVVKTGYLRHLGPTEWDEAVYVAGRFSGLEPSFVAVMCVLVKYFPDVMGDEAYQLVTTRIHEADKTEALAECPDLQKLATPPALASGYEEAH